MPRIAGQPSKHGRIKQALLRGDSLESVQAFARTLTPNSWYNLRNLEKMRRELNGEIPIRQVVRQASATPINSALGKGIDTDMTFGVEIEFLRKNDVSKAMIIRKLREVGIEAREEGYNHDTRTYWKLISDSSVRTHNNTHSGSNEIVSPILKGVEGLKQVEKVGKVLDALSSLVNKTCGLHIHHGLNNFTVEEATNIMKKTVLIYKRYQGYFNAMLPKSRRNAYYARTFTTSDIRSMKRYGINGSDSHRQKVVNVTAYWRHKTVEFRQHSGTIDFTKIVNWIKITQMILKKAIEMPSNDIWEQRLGRFSSELTFTPELKKYIKERVKKFKNVA